MKLLTVNIEGRRHLEERILPFLVREAADLVTLQEVNEGDVPALQEACGGHFIWRPMCIDRDGAVRGVGIGAKHPFAAERVRYYRGDPNHPLQQIPPVAEMNNENADSVKVYPLVEVQVNGIWVGTNHFIWTVAGESTSAQQEGIRDLLALMDENEPYVLTGDFNAPRGRATWEMIAAQLKDNIPAEIGSSLDGDLHRAGPLPYVVDGIFTTDSVRVSNVQMHTGVSDHCGFTAEVDLVGTSTPA